MFIIAVRTEFVVRLLSNLIAGNCEVSYLPQQLPEAR
jgi:hypothetical protein